MSEDDFRLRAQSELVFTYGVRELADHKGHKVDIASALNEKKVGLLFMDKSLNDPIVKGISFMQHLCDVVQANESKFAVVLVCAAIPDEESVAFLEGRGCKGFFTLLEENNETKLTMKEEYFGLGSSFPHLVILDEQGRLISDWGRSAVVWNSKKCFNEWTLGKPGVSWTQILLGNAFKSL